MKYFILRILITVFFFHFGPAMKAQDTILLKTVEIKEDFTKKPKVKKVKFGDENTEYINHGFHFTAAQEGFYLIDSIPYGTLQELILKFGAIRKDINFHDVPFGKNVLKTEYDLTFYEESESGILKKINSKPLKVILEAGSGDNIKKKIDLSAYNIKTNHFYIYLHRTTEMPCDRCNTYVPVFFKKEGALIYIKDEPTTISNPDQVIVKPYDIKSGLLIELKTLTREY